MTHQPQTSSSSGSKRPPNVKLAKKDLGNGKTCEKVACAQMQPSFEMARATRITTQILQDTQHFFAINLTKISNPMAHEYIEKE